MPKGLIIAATVALMLMGAGERACGEDADFETQRKQYEAYLERPSLYMRHRGRVRFAETGDPRALRVLARSYRSPEQPKEQVRSLLVSICAEHFAAAEHTDALREWRARESDEEDAWLWYRTLQLELKARGPEELIAVVHGRKHGSLRAAALLALAEGKDGNTLPVLARLLDDMPPKPIHRCMLLEAAAEVLWLTRGKRSTKEWQEAAAKLIPWMDDRSVQPRTTLVLARRFAAIWKSKELHRDAATWRARLEGTPLPAPAAAGERYAAPKTPFFLGVEGSGARIAYVIDMSDSMLTPLTVEEITDLRKTPVQPVITGGEARKESGQDGDAPPNPVDALPWPLIKTRFDAAREFLVLSLRNLPETARFCVVGFGSEAAVLPATKGLVRAKATNVEKAVRALYAIQPGPRERGRPLGTLGGYTNLHGGLRRAFMVDESKVVERDASVEARLFWEGCDTVFVLSDGKPTWDDWPTKDTLDPDNKPGDPEFGREVEESKTATFYGPFAIASWLLDDLRRLNLLRHVEIHCIGLGEYDPRLLAAVAHAGQGVFRRIGAKER